MIKTQLSFISLILLNTFCIGQDVTLSRLNVQKNEVNSQNRIADSTWLMPETCLISDENGGIFELKFWPNGSIESRSQIELYLEDGIKYRINVNTGASEEIHYKFPCYRYHGNSFVYDNSGRVILEKKKYRHGVLVK